MTLDRLRAMLPRSLKRPVRRAVDTLRVTLAYADMRFRPRGPRREAQTGGEEPPHICLLAWFFPPTISGGTYRPLSIAAYAAEAGLRVTVLAGPRAAETTDAGAHLLSKIPSAVSVAHVPDRPTPLSWAATDLDGEDGWLDVYRTYSAGRWALGRTPPTYVMASGPPFHTFVSAYFLARRFGAKLILDYRDEWTECPFEFVSVGPRDRFWEDRCLRAADHVVFTTRSQLDHQVETFPGLDPGKCRVVPNGWEPADGSYAPPVTDDPGSTKLLLSYVGNLGDHTDPGPFLRTLERAIERSPDLAQDVTLRFVGQKSRRALEGLREFAYPEILELQDHVARPAALEEMRRSSALLLFNNEEFQRYIPGKLYDYLASGRPVLVHGGGGEVAALVSELEGHCVVPAGDAASLAEGLDEIRGFSHSRQSRERLERWLALHTRRRLALRLLELLDSVDD